jgi:hypothetical protein
MWSSPRAWCSRCLCSNGRRPRTNANETEIETTQRAGVRLAHPLQLSSSRGHATGLEPASRQEPMVGGHVLNRRLAGIGGLIGQHDCCGSPATCTSHGNWVYVAGLSPVAKSAKNMRRQCSHGVPGGGWSCCWTAVGSRCPHRVGRTPGGCSPVGAIRCTQASSGDSVQRAERVIPATL